MKKARKGCHWEEQKISCDLKKRPYKTHRLVKDKVSKPAKKTWWGEKI